MNINVETSARHVHLSQNDLDLLFGKGAALTVKKELSQPGQYACVEKVTVKGPKGEINGVSVLGPVRNNTQVEISMTDARKIGISAPIRESGHIEGTPGCTLIGPKGEVELGNGVIVAKRHIHLDPETADEIGVSDNQVVKVDISTQDRSMILGDVVVRVSDKFKPAMHIDTDESNAAGISGQLTGEIIL